MEEQAIDDAYAAARAARLGPGQMKCGKCGTVHGIVEQCPPQKEEEMEERTVYQVDGTIKFTAAVWKVSTLADGGIRLVLDLEEKARNYMPFLAECQQNDIALEIEANKTD